MGVVNKTMCAQATDQQEDSGRMQLQLFIQAPVVKYTEWQRVETLVSSAMIDEQSSQSNYRDTFSQ